MQREGARAALCSHWPELSRASGSRSRTLSLPRARVPALSPAEVMLGWWAQAGGLRLVPVGWWSRPVAVAQTFLFVVTVFAPRKHYKARYRIPIL
jgi:hypothetical protein